MHKCLLLVILLLMIGLGIVSGFFIEKTLHFNQLTDKLKELNIEKSEIETIFFLIKIHFKKTIIFRYIACQSWSEIWRKRRLLFL
jgi:predicted MPP superfamily phosphohydrolase